MDVSDDLWELLQFFALERILLRSFLDYLAAPPPPQMESKFAEIKQWRQHIGLQLGNTKLDDQLSELLQKLRGESPEEAHEAIQRILADARALYFSPRD